MYNIKNLKIITGVILASLLLSLIFISEIRIALFFISTVVGLVVFTYIKVVKILETLRLNRNELKNTIGILNETASIAKIGGWELNVSNGELNWTDETFRILEVEKKNDQNPMLPEGLALFTPKSAPIIDLAVKRAIEFGEAYDLELEALTTKGKVVWVQTNGRANYLDGKVVSVSGVIQDISERKQRDLERSFVAESMGFGLWKFDPITNALEWDDRMYTLYGVDPKMFAGAYDAWENTLSAKAKEDAVKELGLALSGEKDFNTEFEITLNNGKNKWIAGKGFVVRNEKNEAQKMYGFNWDVTDRVSKENELKITQQKLVQNAKLASLGEMSAGIAHEINNPLAIISGSTSLLEKYKNEPSKFNSKIQAIEKSCDRIAKIVLGLKKFSRTDEIKHYNVHSLNEIVKEVIVLTESKSKKYNTPLIFEAISNSSINCDEIEIEQVLVNLISNGIDAVKANTEKWVKISILEDPSWVILRIVDSGSGIPASIRNKLFDPFFTTKGIGEGTGLGLSISKGILDEHKSTISVDASSPNTCFEIKFPKIT